MKKLISALLVAVMLLAVLAGCNNASSNSAASTGPWKPERAVNIVIPANAGGSTDLLGRTIEKVWPKYCDQPVQIVNKPGGGGVTGAVYVSNSAPDGYTLELGYGSGHDVSMPFLQKLEYDPFTALAPIARISVHTVMLAVPANSEFQTLADIFEWSKTTGQTITAASSTANGTANLVLLALAAKTGTNITVIPHEGGNPAITTLVGGQTTMGGAHPSELMPQAQAGRLRIIGVATDERDSSMPDIPTLKEQGIDFSSWGSIKGIACPIKTPDNIKAYYSDLFKKICEDEEFIKLMTELGQPVMYEDTEAFTKSFQEAVDFYKQLIEDVGLTYKG